MPDGEAMASGESVTQSSHDFSATTGICDHAGAVAHDEADQLGHGFVVGGRNELVEFDGGVERPGQRRVFDDRHAMLLGDGANAQRHDGQRILRWRAF